MQFNPIFKVWSIGKEGYFVLAECPGNSVVTLYVVNRQGKVTSINPDGRLPDMKLGYELMWKALHPRARAEIRAHYATEYSRKVAEAREDAENEALGIF
jgi:hypothetical protein